MCCNKANLAFILNESIPTPAMQPTAAPASPLPAFSLQSASSAPSSPAMQMPMPVRYPTITPRDAEIRMTMKQHLASFKRLAICDLLSPEPTYKVSLPAVVATSAPTTPTTNSAPTMPKRRKVVNCQVPDCKSRALTRKLCMRHGGGSRCQFPGCTNGAKLRNLCFQHGGSTTCMVPECDNIAKRFGYCWTHGGAYVCSAPNCKKFAAQGGLCWAHGGGNRCGFEGCTKRSYKQYDYRCKEHAKATTA